MNKLQKLVVAYAAACVRKPIEEYCEDVNWDNDDAEALREFLKSSTGKKLLQNMVLNSSKCLNKVFKCEPEKLVEVKAESKAWLTLKSVIQAMTISKREIQSNKLSDDKLDKIFADIISSSSRVNGSAILGR